MPSVRLDTTRLKRARERRRLTAKQLVAEAFSDGGSKSKSLESQIRMYQQIEQTGRTSLDRANRIEEALGVERGSLHLGADIADAGHNLAEKLKARVRELHESNNQALIVRLAQLFGMNAEELVNTRDWEWRDCAEDLSRRLAIASLQGETEQLQVLGQLTGMSDKEIGCPLLGESLWWLASNEWLSEQGLGKLLLGFGSLRHEIQQAWDKELPNWFRCEPETAEVRSSLVRNGSRFRLVITGAHQLQCSFEFCVCDASRDHGIRWKEADEWDEERVRQLIGDLMQERSDVVSIDGQSFPPENADLRLHISFYKIKCEKWELPTWEARGEKTFINDWGFRVALQTFLKAQPEERLDIQPEAAGVAIKLRSWNRGDFRTPEFLSKVLIRWGWFDDFGRFHDAPWPEARRRHFIEHYKQLSLHSPIIVPDDDFVVPELAPTTLFQDDDAQ